MDLARCELCDRYDPASEMLAFALKVIPDRRLELVTLNGRAPWSGVRCICIDCANFVGANSEVHMKLRKIVSNVPGKIMIAAKEKAGFPTYIKPMEPK